MGRESTVTFFGHRDAPQTAFPSLLKEVETAAAEGYDTFLVGGKGRFDSMAAHAVRQIRKQYPEICLYLVLSYMPGSPSKQPYFPEDYDGTIYPEGLETVPPRFAISHRNRWMVENSRRVICYVAAGYGGACTAMQYAKRKGCEVINIKERADTV